MATQSIGKLALEVVLDTAKYRDGVPKLRRQALLDGRKLEKSFATGFKQGKNFTGAIERMRKEQVKLGRAAKQTAGDTDKLNRALRRTKKEINEAEKEMKTFRATFLGTFLGNVAAKSLSLLVSGLNRVRRGLLSMKDATIESFFELRRAEIAMDAVSDSTEQSAKRFEFARNMARALGFETGTLVNEYVKLNASFQDANFTQAETEKVFTAFVGNARLFGQSLTDIELALLGVNQTAGRSVIQGDELNQIVDRIPGGLSLLRKGLGLTSEQFSEMRSKGILPARESLLVLAEAMSERNAQGLPAAMADSQASADRYKASLFDLRANIGSVIAPIQAGFQDLGSEIFNNLSRNTDIFERLTEEAKIFGEELSTNPETVRQISGIIDRLLTASLRGTVSLAQDLSKWLDQEDNIRDLREGLEDARKVLDLMVKAAGAIVRGIARAAELSKDLAVGVGRTLAVLNFQADKFDQRYGAREQDVTREQLSNIEQQVLDEFPRRSDVRRPGNVTRMRDERRAELIAEQILRNSQQSDRSGVRQRVGTTGNSGVGSGPHLHAQILGGERELSSEELGRFTDASGTPLSQQYTTTGRFGDSRERFRGPGAIHQGTDLATPTGTPIFASRVVDVSPLVERGGAGWSNVVTFDDGLKVELFHQSPRARGRGGGGSGGAVRAGGHGRDHGTLPVLDDTITAFQDTEVDRSAVRAAEIADREAAAEARRITQVRREIDTGSEDTAQIFEDLVGQTLELRHLFEDLHADLDTSEAADFNRSMAALRRNAEGFLIEQRDATAELHEQEEEILEQIKTVEEALESEAISAEESAELLEHHNQGLRKVQGNIEAMSKAAAQVVGLYEAQADNLRVAERERLHLKQEAENAAEAEAIARLRDSNETVRRQQGSIFESGQDALIEARQSRGLGTRDLERNQALRSERGNLNSQLRDLDTFAADVDLDPAQLAAMRNELVQISELRLDTITRQFDTWNGELLPSILGQTKGLFHDLITKPGEAGASLGNFFSNISSRIADVATELAFSGLFSLLGIGGGLGGGGGGLVNIFSSGISALGGSKIQKFQSGGIVGGAEGLPAPAIVHGGEVVLNKAQQRSLLGGKSGTSNNMGDIVFNQTFTMSGGGTTPESAKKLARTIEATVESIIIREQGFRGKLSK